MVDESKTSKVKQKKTAKKENKSLKQRFGNGIFYRPTVIQRIKPRKRNAVLSEKDVDSMGKSEEFDSDEHIENANDWHDELDVIKMPHLLGPSATKYSPVPLKYQHLSTFSTSSNSYRSSPTFPMFGCYQILVQFTGSTPLISYVPCNYYQSFNNRYQPYY